MDLVLDPPRGVGPLRIGMPFLEGEQVLRSIDGYLPPKPGDRPNPGFAHYESELSISLSSDQSALVTAIEVYRPSFDVVVLFQGMSVFETPAEEVIEWFSAITEVEVEDEGLRILAPNLLLSMWRSVLSEGPEDDDGKYFEAVLVAAPGLYD